MCADMRAILGEVAGSQWARTVLVELSGTRVNLSRVIVDRVAQHDKAGSYAILSRDLITDQGRIGGLKKCTT
jgi:hypothetical protein